MPGPLSKETWEPEFEINVRAVNGLRNYTLPDAWSSLKPGTVDVLLTHETPKGRLRGFDSSGRRDNYGSEKMAEFIRRLTPVCHFFGHHHWYYPETVIESDIGAVRSVGMNQVFFENRKAVISRGAFGILKVSCSEPDSSKEFNFSIVDDPWYQELCFADVAHVL